jgi:hypothetical protein
LGEFILSSSYPQLSKSPGLSSPLSSVENSDSYCPLRQKEGVEEGQWQSLIISSAWDLWERWGQTTEAGLDYLVKPLSLVMLPLCTLKSYLEPSQNWTLFCSQISDQGCDFQESLGQKKGWGLMSALL